MVVSKFCLILFLSLANIVFVGMKRKKHHRYRFRCSEFLKYSNVLRREYALYLEEIPEALIYNFPDTLIKEERHDWTHDSKFKWIYPCDKRTKDSSCHTRIDMDFNPNRYPSIIFQARCCGQRHFPTITCREGKAPKHVLVRKHLKRNKRLSSGTRIQIRRGRWCTFERAIQIISVRCEERIVCESARGDSAPPEH